MAYRRKPEPRAHFVAEDEPYEGKFNIYAYLDRPRQQEDHKPGTIFYPMITTRVLISGPFNSRREAEIALQDGQLI